MLCARFAFPVHLQIAVGDRPHKSNGITDHRLEDQRSKTTGSTGERSGKRTLSDVLIGPPRDVRDPEIFHSLSLVAFLAWVGLGSDGLSSSCYGPEEAFLALGHHQYLAVFLAMLMALTVFIISASYSQTIDLFPTGGGGYLVATKLLGKYFGLVSGSALVVDYVLTIAISIASGADAIFSFLPVSWLPFKFWLCLLVVALMVLMNLRGVKESVLSLLPIFIAFIIMHAWLVGYAILSRAPELPSIVGHAVREVHASAHSMGMFALAVIFFRAYSLGGGTYTGIEAVSNGLPILREPRAETGKRTMMYMAVSLAFLAGGILLGYLLLNVEAEVGKTLNAVMFERLASNWQIFGVHVGTRDCHLHAADRGRAAVRCRADRLRRRTARARDDGVRPMAAATLRKPERTAGDAGRRHHHRTRRHAAAHRHRGESRYAGRPLRNQRLRDLHPFAARHDDALVARAQERKAMASQAAHQRHRDLLHRDHPRSSR